MPRRVLDEKTLVPISMIISIVGGIFWLSNIYHQGVDNQAAILEMRSDLKVLLAMRTDVEVIKVKVEQLQKPVINTRADVKTVKNALFSGPVHRTRLEACNAFGPLTMIGQ